MTGPAAIGGDGRAASSRASEADGPRTLTSPHDLVWETARVVASASLDRPFADELDAFATWLAYHRLLNQVRRFAFRVLGAQHELVQTLRPWLEPLAVAAAPRNPAGAAWVQATLLLENAPIPLFGAKRNGDRDGHAPAASGDHELLVSVTQLVLMLAAAGEALSRSLTEDGACLRSAALQLEARRLGRHAPRLALAAVTTLESLSRGTDDAEDLRAGARGPGSVVSVKRHE